MTIPKLLLQSILGISTALPRGKICDPGMDSLQKKEYNTMDAHIFVVNDSEMLLKFQDYTHFGQNINME